MNRKIIILMMSIATGIVVFSTTPVEVGANQLSVDLLSQVTDENLDSKYMIEAFDVYQDAVKNMEFHSLGSGEWTGDSIEEVRAKVSTDLEPVESTIEGALDFRFLLYSFTDSALDVAEVGFLFAEGHLVFVGLGNIVTNFDDNILANEIADELANAGTDFAKIVDSNAVIKAFGHVSVDEEGRDIVAIDSGESSMEANTYFYMLADGKVEAHDKMDIFSAMQGIQTIMFDQLAFHYVDGQIGSVSEPTAVSLEPITVETDLTVDPLKDLMTDTTITNPKFVEAWEGYQLALSDLTFRDLASEEPLGSLIKDVEENFDPGIKPRYVEFPDTPIKLLVYTYEDSEVNPNTGMPDVGEFALYFFDDLLAYASVANRSLVIEAEQVLSIEEIDQLTKESASLDALISLNPQVISMGYMYQNTEPRSIVAIQSGDPYENRQVSFLFLRDDLIRGQETYAIEEVMQDIQTNMLFSTGDFFTNEARQLDQTE